MISHVDGRATIPTSELWAHWPDAMVEMDRVMPRLLLPGEYPVYTLSGAHLVNYHSTDLVLTMWVADDYLGESDFMPFAEWSGVGWLLCNDLLRRLGS